MNHNFIESNEVPLKTFNLAILQLRVLVLQQMPVQDKYEKF